MARRGGSNAYPQSLFLHRNKKNVYPCKPQFYYIKVRLRGSKLYRHGFVMCTSKPSVSPFLKIYNGNVMAYKTLYKKDDQINIFYFSAKIYCKSFQMNTHKTSFHGEIKRFDAKIVWISNQRLPPLPPAWKAIWAYCPEPKGQLIRNLMVSIVMIYTSKIAKIIITGNSR